MTVLRAFGSFNTGTAAAGNTIVVSGLTDPDTGSAFTPKFGIFWWSGRSESSDTVGRASNYRGMGLVCGPTDRRAAVNISVDALAASDTSRLNQNDACIVSVTATNVLDGAIDHQSWDSGGFTLIIDTQMPRDLRANFLVFGGDDFTNYATGEFQEPTTAGDQDITGLSFQPDNLLLLSIGNAAATGGTTTASLMIGAATGYASQAVCSGISFNNSATMSTGNVGLSGECIVLQNTAASINARARFKEFLSNGFRVTWRERNNTRFVFFLATQGAPFAVFNSLTQTDTTTSISESFLGFKPKGGLIISHCNSESLVDAASSNDRLSIGGFASLTSRGAQATLDENGVADSEVSTAIETDAILANISTASAIEGLMDVKSIPHHAIELIMDDADPQRNFFFGWVFGESVTGSPEAVHLQVSQNADDMSQSGAGTMSDTTFNTQTSANDWYGVRVQNVPVAPGDYVVAARGRVYAHIATNDNPAYNVHAEDADNAAVFDVGTAFNISDRTLTTAFVNWTGTDIGAPGFATLPDLSEPVQEVINRVGWAENNALAFILDAQTGNAFSLRSHNFDPVYAFKLDLEWVTPAIVYKDDASLVSLWLMEEASGTRLDDVGPNDLSDNATVASSADAMEGSLSADFERSNSEYLDISNASQVGLDITGSLTICLWVKLESAVAAVLSMVAKHQNSAGDHGYAFQLDANQKLVARLSGDGSSDTTLTGATSLAAATWYHVALVYDGAFIKLYLNARLEGFIAYSSGIFDNSIGFTVGRSTGATDYFDGLMDEVAVFNRALTQAELAGVLLNNIEEPVGGGDLTVTLDTLSLVGSIPALAAVPGAALVTMDTLTLAGTVQSLTLVTLTSILLDTLTLAGAIQALTVTPGGAAVALDTLSLAGSIQDLTLAAGAASITLDTLTLAGNVQGLAVTAGGVSVLLDTLSLSGSVEDLTIALGALAILLDTLSLTASVQALTVGVGGVTITLDTLTLAGSVEELSLVAGILIALSTLSLAGSVQSLTVLPGGVSALLDTLTLAGSVQALTALPGGVTIPLDTLTLAGDAQALALLSNAFVSLDTLTLAAQVESLSLLPGGVAISLDTLSLAGSVPALTLIMATLSEWVRAEFGSKQPGLEFEGKKPGAGFSGKKPGIEFEEG